MKALLLLAAATALSACASAPTEGTAESDAMICTRETPIGSNFPVTKCRTPQQVAQDKADAERTKADIRQTTSFRPSE